MNRDPLCYEIYRSLFARYLENIFHFRVEEEAYVDSRTMRIYITPLVISSASPSLNCFPGLWHASIAFFMVWCSWREDPITVASGHMTGVFTFGTLICQIIVLVVNTKVRWDIIGIAVGTNVGF